MNKKPMWGFGIKRKNFLETFFGIVYADTKDEAKETVLDSLKREGDKEILQFFTLDQIPDGDHKMCVIGGTKGPAGTTFGMKDKKIYKFKARVRSTFETFYGVVKASDKQEVIEIVINTLANEDRRGFRVFGIEEIFSNPNYPIDILGGK